MLRTASNTFHRTYIKPTPQLFEFTLGSKTEMVHISSIGILLCYRMLCISVTSFYQQYRLGGGCFPVRVGLPHPHIDVFGPEV